MASPQKENGYTSIANELLDEIIKTQLTGSDYSVLFFVIRNTYGFNRKKHKMSITYFQKGCKLSRRTIINSLKRLVKAGILVKKKTALITEYGLQKDYEKWLVKKTALVKTSALELVKTSAPNKERITKKDIYICAFDQFWSLYPRKVNKKKAYECWKKIKPDLALFKKILSAVKKQSLSKQWLDSGGKYIPHPTTWLNGQRWEDEEEITTERIISI